MSAHLEGWILAGAVDGRPATPAPMTDIAGMPHALRHACSLAAAGADRIYILWIGARDEAFDVQRLAADPRLGGASLALAASPPAGGTADPVVLIRGDRVAHRELPKLVAAATRDHGETLVKVEGEQYDSVFASDRATATRLFEAAKSAGGMSTVLADLRSDGGVHEVPPPYLGFSTAAPDPRARRRAEWLLVKSLRKTADGYAARVLNRHISLFVTRYLCKTPVRPNHVTVVCLLAALAGGWLISHATWSSGVWGFLLVELGSIFDGIDGELSRLKYRFSRLGQWMDTVTDDVSNVFYVTGTMIALEHAGVDWAVPLGLSALTAFVITQSIQYYYIAVVYKSGDLAAIPWAFQSTESLSARPKELLPRIKAAIPRFLKRDFVVTLFVALAFVGRLDIILVIFSAGALSFLFSFTFQLVRYRSGRLDAASGTEDGAPSP